MPITRPIDTLVLGGGMAGTFAALAAKTPDTTVAIVEPANVLGGQGTAGGVAGFCGDSQRVNAPFARLVETLAQHELIAEYDPLADRRAYDLELCAFFLQEMVAAAGVEILFHARALTAQCAGGHIASVEVACASDRIEFWPGMVVDATGDCALAHAAGFETIHEGANKQLPMSLYFVLWDTGRPVTPFLPPGCPTWDDDEALPMTTLHVFPSGKVEVKMKVVGFDAADGQSLSRAELHARRQMMGLIYYLQTKGYRGTRLDTHILASVSRHIGAREGRRIVGEYLLTEEDVTHACTFPDAVAVGTYHLDYHWPDRVERAGTGITTMVEPYHIPLRSLVPKGAANLLVAGRSASGDQMAMSSFRIQATCAQMGFAAGTAARICQREEHDLQDAPLAAIQQAIEAGDQSLDLSAYGDYLRHLIHIREHLFADDRPFAQCHASTLVQLKNGVFLAAWFGGTREGHADVGIWGAERRHGRWSAPRCLAKVRDCAPLESSAPRQRRRLRLSVLQGGRVDSRLGNLGDRIDRRRPNLDRAEGTSAGRPGRARASQKQAPRARRWHVASRGLAGKGRVGGLCRSQRGPRRNLAGQRSHSTRPLALYRPRRDPADALGIGPGSDAHAGPQHLRTNRS